MLERERGREQQRLSVVREVGAAGPSAVELDAWVSAREPFVLRFPVLTPDACEAQLAMLAARCPDHAVFQGAPDPLGTFISLLPVVPRATLVAHHGELVAAIAGYRAICAELLERRQARRLGRMWRVEVHGEHCRFEHRSSGQIIEALLEGGADSPVDPYFFALYLRTTAGMDGLAALLVHDFHDAARMLDFVAGHGPATISRSAG